ncbi:MAG: DUF2059 domain-containing protein [Acidobacteriota bacterium]
MDRRFLWIALATLTCAGLASSASAQAPAPAPPKSPAAKAPAAAPTPTAAQSAAAMEFFKAIKLEESIPGTSAAMIDSELSRNPGMAPYRDVMVNWLKKYMTWKAMLPELIQAYSETYSEAELKDLTAFYKTPVGQKSLQKAPELVQKTAMIGAKLGQEHSEELKTLMNARRDELMKQQEKSQGGPASKVPANKAPAPAKPATPAPKKP